jgi:hypothetical protein
MDPETAISWQSLAPNKLHHSGDTGSRNESDSGSEISKVVQFLGPETVRNWLFPDVSFKDMFFFST